VYLRPASALLSFAGQPPALNAVQAIPASVWHIRWTQQDRYNLPSPEAIHAAQGRGMGKAWREAQARNEP